MSAAALRATGRIVIVRTAVAEIAGAVGVLEAVVADVAAADAVDATEAAVDAIADAAVPAADGTNPHQRFGLIHK